MYVMTQTVRLPFLHDADPFADRLAAEGRALSRGALTTLQLNVTKACNLACHHCHVESSPARTETMSWDTMLRVFDWLDAEGQATGIHRVDITGGAPEMNPFFKDLVERLRQRGLHVLDRCNLTILLEEGYEDMAAFLAAHEVEIVASLPCYLPDNVDKQRGQGVYWESVEALKKLNALGYGMDGSNLTLDLVYNPVGYGLPPAQASLEADYKKHLAEQFGIHFNRLFTITNMPIKRFEHALRRDGEYEAYMAKLMSSHTPANVDAVMCTELVSVGYGGAVYDCDFNQALLMPLDGPSGDTTVDGCSSSNKYTAEHHVERESRKLWEFSAEELIGRRIRTGAHCFGCTAGHGSSCTGALD